MFWTVIAIFEALGSANKTSKTLEGDHYLTEPAGARAAVADLIDGWIQVKV